MTMDAGVSRETSERLALLEQKIAAHDELIRKIVAYAGSTAFGRALLKSLGIS